MLDYRHPPDLITSLLWRVYLIRWLDKRERRIVGVLDYKGFTVSLRIHTESLFLAALTIGQNASCPVGYISPSTSSIDGKPQSTGRDNQEEMVL
jgi:hypothetical protein